jgi:hypothetical protein
MGARCLCGATVRCLFLLVAIVLVSTQFAFVLRAALKPAPDQGFERADCVASVKGGKRAGSSRDCGAGQGPACTRAEPCTPCVVSGDCAECQAGAGGIDRAACFFEEGFGPYCAFGFEPQDVRACTRCCS